MTSINLSEHADLPDRLKIDFSPGRISLERNRMVLLHASAMASLRKELIDTLGIQRARGVLTRMGYESGRKDAELARRLLPDAFDEDLLKVGPSLHTVEDLKYFEPDRVVDQIIHLQTEVEKLRLSLEEDTTLLKGMVGSSASFRESCKLLHKAADSDITVEWHLIKCHSYQG